MTNMELVILGILCVAVGYACRPSHAWLGAMLALIAFVLVVLSFAGALPR